MTKQTLTPKKRLRNEKNKEISRLLFVMDTLCLQPIDIKLKSGVSTRTIQNTIYDNLPIGGKLLRALNTHYQVSIDWLLTGKGKMFMDEGIKEPRENYEPNLDRKDRISTTIDKWMDQATTDELAWLEIELKNKISALK